MLLSFQNECLSLKTTTASSGQTWSWIGTFTERLPKHYPNENQTQMNLLVRPIVLKKGSGFYLQGCPALDTELAKANLAPSEKLSGTFKGNSSEIKVAIDFCSLCASNTYNMRRSLLKQKRGCPSSSRSTGKLKMPQFCIVWCLLEEHSQ